VGQPAQKIGNDDPRVAAAIDRAIELDENDQSSSAVQLLARLAEEFPQTASVHAYLGWFLLRVERTADAVGHARQAVELAPGSEKASLIYFHTLWKSGQQAQALDEMKRFIAIQPSNEYSALIDDWGLEGNRESPGTGNPGKSGDRNV
jgi:predicted Zn-dependent protease